MVYDFVNIKSTYGLYPVSPSHPTLAHGPKRKPGSDVRTPNGSKMEARVHMKLKIYLHLLKSMFERSRFPAELVEERLNQVRFTTIRPPGFRVASGSNEGLTLLEHQRR